ncbi:MAG: hypothetical protein AB7G44_02190 [Bacteroidia bacterium]
MISSSELLLKISELQSKGDKYYARGLFPSQRFHLHLPFEREDNNIFFTASIVFILQNLREKLPREEQKFVDEICIKAVANYPDYKNKDSLDTYNFWRTDGSPHFPNGNILSRINKVRIPDDADDTSLIYLTSNPSHEKALWLKEKLAQHTNLSKKQVTNTFPEYKNLKAYSTFFGKNMFIEFDVCVLCNILYFVFQNKLELNQHDHDSIFFIRSVIEKKQYLEKPFYASHSYPSASVILYHVARLLEKFEVPGLSEIKLKVISDLIMLFEKEENEMNRIILSTSLVRLGSSVPILSILKGEAQRWSFFHAGLLTAFESEISYSLAGNSFVHLKYKCEAHRLALLLENMIYQR